MSEQKKISILLVEDEENLHEALKLNLELEGYEVTSAFDGVAALEAVKDEYFDLIILDDAVATNAYMITNIAVSAAWFPSCSTESCRMIWCWLPGL